MSSDEAVPDDPDRRRLREASAERVMGWHVEAMAWATKLDVEVWHGGGTRR